MFDGHDSHIQFNDPNDNNQGRIVEIEYDTMLGLSYYFVFP